MSSQNPHHARRWAILAVLGIAQLMVVLDATIVNIALPSAQRSLEFSDESRQWVVTAYALAFGSLLLLGGRIGDLFGRKRVFIAGLIGFAVASAIGGAADSFGVLVASRALQGVFGALLAPAALSLLTTTFTEPGERAKAFGIFGAIAGGGAAIGLLLGGVLTEYLSWRWCLYVNLLFAIPAAIAAYSLLVNQVPATRPRLDIPGTLTATTGLLALVYGFSHAETSSWGDSLTIALLAASADPADRLRGHPAPLQPPAAPAADRARPRSRRRLPGHGHRRRRHVRRLPVPDLLPAEHARLLADQVRPGVPADVGRDHHHGHDGDDPPGAAHRPEAAGHHRHDARLGGDAAVRPAARRLELRSSHILPALLVLGVGLGLVFSPAFSGATVGVEPSDAGVASAMVNTSQQVGGSVGTALL